MRRTGFTKNEARRLQLLAEIACNRELNHDLHHVARACRDFQEGHVDELSLDELIRDYVHGASARVLARYRELEPEVIVARAVALDYLEPGELSATLRRKLAPRVSGFKKALL